MNTRGGSNHQRKYRQETGHGVIVWNVSLVALRMRIAVVVFVVVVVVVVVFVVVHATL